MRSRKVSLLIRASNGCPGKIIKLDQKEYAKLHKTLSHAEIVNLVREKERQAESNNLPAAEVPVENVVSTTEVGNAEINHVVTVDGTVVEQSPAEVALATLMRLYQCGQYNQLAQYTRGQLHRRSLGCPVVEFDKAQHAIRLLYFGAHVINKLPLPEILPTVEGQFPVTYGVHYIRETINDSNRQAYVDKGGNPNTTWLYRHADGTIEPKLEEVHSANPVYARQLMPNDYTRVLIDSAYDRLMWVTLGGNYDDAYMYLNSAGKMDPWLGMKPPDDPFSRGIFADKEFAQRANHHPEIFPLVLTNGAVRVRMADTIRYGISEIQKVWAEKGGSGDDIYVYVLPNGELDVSFHMMLKMLQPYRRSLHEGAMADVATFTENDILVRGGLASASTQVIDQYLEHRK